MQVPPPLHAVEKEATEIVVGPLSAVLAGVVQSTWNFHSCRLFVPKLSRKFGDPLGGGVDPSRSDGSRLPKDELRVKHCWVAARPSSIFARSYAQACGPRNCVPALLNMLNVV